MYKLLLTLKYLRRKLAPMFAALAVMLCTMMVIVVISVMGGFLEKLTESVQMLTGDVTVTAHSLTGFPHYENLVEKLEARPEIDAATPVIRTYGLVHMAGTTFPLQIYGVRPHELDQIVQYRSALHWSTSDYVKYLEQTLRRDPQAQTDFAQRIRDRLGELEERGMTFEPPELWQPVGDEEAGDDEASDGEAAQDNATLPGAVLGIEANPRHSRDAQGQYSLGYSAMSERIALTMMPLTEAGAFADSPVRRSLVVVNEFKSGVYEVDSNRIYVPFDWLQQQLEMQAEETWEYDPETLERVGEPIIEPARTTEVVLRGAPGAPLAAVQAAANEVVDELMREHADMPLIYPMTWREQHGHLLAAVQNEIGLVTFLFAIISLVAVVMVATTFYMIVLEKTRDIGVLRAVGASRWGIAGLFLGYGLAIGVVGALLGCAAAVAIVTHLNEIQTLLNDWFGWQMWNPQTYYFDRIPDQVEPVQATLIVLAAIVSSVIGALIPALLAARLNPVEALRYE